MTKTNLQVKSEIRIFGLTNYRTECNKGNWKKAYEMKKEVTKWETNNSNNKALIWLKLLSSPNSSSSSYSFC